MRSRAASSCGASVFMQAARRFICHASALLYLQLQDQFLPHF